MFSSLSGTVSPTHSCPKLGSHAGITVCHSDLYFISEQLPFSLPALFPSSTVYLLIPLVLFLEGYSSRQQYSIIHSFVKFKLQVTLLTQLLQKLKRSHYLDRCLYLALVAHIGCDFGEEGRSVALWHNFGGLMFLGCLDFINILRPTS